MIARLRNVSRHPGAGGGTVVLGMTGNQARSGLHALAYAAVLAAVIYVIVDLEFPRPGMIRVDTIDRVLVDVREGMK